MIETRPLTFEDFSGGITDNFIDCALNQYNEAENFLVSENKKLEPIAGAEVYDIDKPQLPIGVQRVGTIIDFFEELLFQSNKKIYYDDAATWGTIIGPTGNDAFTTGDANSVISYAKWNNHLLLTNDEYSPTMKVYRDDSNNIQLRSAGLPALASSPSVAGVAGSNDYIYAFVYFYEYKVGTVTFQDFGPTERVQKLSVEAPDISTIAVTSIPTLSNGATYNWDTTVIKVKIYRTQAGGTTLYYVGEVTNGTSVYNDTSSDSTISSNATLYTTGGVLDNTEPPLAKTIHVANGACWYGNIKTGTEIISNRVYQSAIDDPDSVPATAYIDLEDEIVAISSYIDRVIVLCKRSIYRLDGTYDDVGGGLVSYQKISDTIGCVSGNSVVQIPNGIVFASPEGFAYSDGFSTFKISEGFNTRYRNLVKTDNQKKRIYGAYDKMVGRVWFSVQKEEGVNDDIDACFILDTRYSVSPSSTFTTAGGMDSFAPTAIIFKDGDLVRGDRRGYILKHDNELLSYPLIDTAKVASTWFDEAIKYNFITMATSFGDSKYRKFVPRVVVRSENVSNISLQITSLTDVGTRERAIPILRWRGNFVWGDPLFTWGNDYFIWGTAGIIEEMRRFHGDDMRCSYRQLQLSNAHVIILESDSLDTATVNSANKTVTIENAGVNDWPEDVGGYTVHFEVDGYDRGYEISLVTLDTLTVLDTGGNLTDGGGQKWIIKGYPKNELLKLLSLTMDYSILGQTQTDYTPASLGGNA